MINHLVSLPGITVFPLVGKEGYRKFKLEVGVDRDSGRLLHLFFSCFRYISVL